MKTLLLLLPLLAYGQAVTGPRSGFVFDTKSKVIRPVNGIPGAATLGEALDLGGLLLDQVEFSGQLAYAVAGANVYRILLNSGQFEPIQGTQPDARLAAPRLLWSAATRTIQILPAGRPAFVKADGDLITAAVNQNCAILAFEATVEQLCDGTNQSRLYAGKATALAADANSIYAISDNQILRLAPDLQVLGTGPQLVGLALAGTSLLAVADAQAQTISFLAVSGKVTPDPIKLLFKPTTLRHLDTQILQLGEAGATPFEVLDLIQQNRSFFIPAIATVGTN